MICRVLPYTVRNGPANMAWDQALLDVAADEPATAVFRVYGWETPTLTLGYFQPVAAARAEPRWQTAPLVRRPTGGGALWHDQELTYALVVPRGHPRFGHAVDLYRHVHDAIAEIIRADGLAARRRGDVAVRPRRMRPFLCFTDTDPADIVIEDTKVVGSAQRRRPGAVLQHGSLLLRRSITTPELPGVSDLGAPDRTAARWAARLEEAIAAALGLTVRADTPTALEQARAVTLEQDVYRNPAWTLRR